MRQPNWDIHEAVILLEGYLELLEKKDPKPRIIKRISTDLRKMACNKGLMIDDVFRNDNGISFQLQSMESAYWGRTVSKKSSQLFADVVALYNTNYKRYENLLKESKSMIAGTVNYKDVFSSWLSETVSPAMLTKLFTSYEKIERFCLNLKVIKTPLFEITDPDILKAVQKTVSKNKLFRIVNKKHLKEIDAAMLCLSRFILDGYIEKANIEPTSMAELSNDNLKTQHHKDGTDPYVRTEEDKRLLAKYPLLYNRLFFALRQMLEKGQCGATVAELNENIKHIARCSWIEDVLDNVSWAKCDNKQYSFSEELKQHDAFTSPEGCLVQHQYVSAEPSKNIIDFNDIGIYAYTKPTALRYFGEAIFGFSSWAGLYVALFSNLYPDYPHLFKTNMSFSRKGGGRTDLCHHEQRKSMVAPKPIPGTSLYLETNISAIGIVEKIKVLLDICNIDYENIVIEYQKIADNVAADQLLAVKQNSTDSLKEFDDKEFASFLREHEGLSERTCRKYISAISLSECFAKEHNYEHHRLITPNWNEAKATFDSLLNDPEFIKINDRQHHCFSAAMGKLLLFLQAETTSISAKYSVTNARPTMQPIVDEFYQNTLIENFYKGFRLGSPIELRKFRRCYELLNGDPLDEDDTEIERKVTLCGIVFEDKVFPPQTMISEELRARLISYINSCFEKGKTVLYYQAVFNEFSEEFLDYYIYNVDMLKSYLSFSLREDYFFCKSYFSKDATATSDPIDEIRICLKNYAAPITYDVLFKYLSHISPQKIKQILSTNSEFISNGRGEYFHVSTVHFSDEEMDNIEEIITDLITEKEFLSGNELIAAIGSKYPYSYEKNSAFSMIGLRDAIKYRLCNRFSFSSNIISRLGSSLTMSEVFENFCRSRDTFTLDELTVLATELGTNIYFDPVYDNSLRISKEKFVSKKHAKFLVEETDDILDRFCSRNYIPIGKISDFSLFPNAEFPWNIFLLEHYTATYSARYSLFHIGFNSNKCVGAIAKKSSGFTSFDDCLVTILADSNIALKKQSALQYLFDEGYIARRVYTNIEELLIRAAAQRNRKEAN